MEILNEWRQAFEDNFDYKITGNCGYLKFIDGKKFTFKTENGMRKAFKNAWSYALHHFVHFNLYMTYREITGKSLLDN